MFGISLVDVWVSDETFLVFDISLLGFWILDKTFLLVSHIPEHPGLFLVHSRYHTTDVAFMDAASFHCFVSRTSCYRQLSNTDSLPFRKDTKLTINASITQLPLLCGHLTLPA